MFAKEVDLIFLHFFLILSFLAGSRALAQETQCEKIFASAVPSLSFRIHPFVTFDAKDIDTSRIYFPYAPVTELGRTRQTADGKIYRIQKIADDNPFNSWGSFYAPANNAYSVHLNPMWPLFILQVRLAAFLGIRTTTAKVILAPDANVLNSRIKKLNAILREKKIDEIPTSFYDERNIKTELKKYPTYVEMFVRRFILKSEFPIIESELTHDIAAHAMNVLFTHELMAPLRARGFALLQLVDAIRSGRGLESLAPDLQSTAAREVIIQGMLRIFSVEIDNFSGQTGWTLGSLLTNDVTRAKQIYEVYFRYGRSYANVISKVQDPSLLQWLSAFSNMALSTVANSQRWPNELTSKLLNYEKDKENLSRVALNAPAIATALNDLAVKINSETLTLDSKMLPPNSTTALGLASFLQRVIDLQLSVNSNIRWEPLQN